MTQTVQTLPGELVDFRAASTAGGGTALTTSKGLISVPLGSDFLSLTGRKFASGAEVIQFLLSPWLTIIFTTDLLTSPGWRNLSEEAQDGDGVDINIPLWDTLANGGALYVGAEVPVRGYAVDLGATVNAVASVLTIKNWNGGAWADVVNSEGTKTATECLSQDGDEAFTVPTAWVGQFD